MIALLSLLGLLLGKLDGGDGALSREMAKRSSLEAAMSLVQDTCKRRHARLKISLCNIAHAQQVIRSCTRPFLDALCNDHDIQSGIFHSGGSSNLYTQPAVASCTI